MDTQLDILTMRVNSLNQRMDKILSEISELKAQSVPPPVRKYEFILDDKIDYILETLATLKSQTKFLPPRRRYEIILDDKIDYILETLETLKSQTERPSPASKLVPE